MILSKWIWPSLIVLSAGLIGSLAFTNSSMELRPLFALWFLLVCPGMAYIRLLSIKETYVQWTLAVALSLALDALVAAILVYAHVWSPNVALLILIVASLVGVGLQVIPVSPKVLKNRPKVTQPAGVDTLWPHKVIKSIDDHLISFTNVLNYLPVDYLSIKSKTAQMSKGKILLVDDESLAHESIRDFMQASGYEILYTQNGDEALNLAGQAEPDLLMVDIELSNKFGEKILQRLRETSSAPIIMLIAQHEEAEIQHSFQLGVDDFIPKSTPFRIVEERIADLLTHSRDIDVSKDMVISDDLTINFKHKWVIVSGQRIHLPPTHYRLLVTLARQPNRTIPMNSLQTNVWGASHEVTKKYVRKVIRSLRKKIELDPGQPKHIKNRRGYGYRFE
jgi:two-component system, OmpR family, KDP operon response regulator KdpE